MKCAVRFAVGLTICFAMGCGQSSENQVANAAREVAPPADPAAQTAHAFLTAMIQGDTSRALNCLTPLAIQRIRESNQELRAPGLDTGTFRVGAVRNPSQTDALVQCFLSDIGPNGQPRSEEICCLLKLIDGRWLVSGIAYQMNPGGQPVIMSFENPDPPQRASSFADSNDGGKPFLPADPPATAQQPSDYPVR